MSSADREQSLALAGIFLALSQIRRIAGHGHADNRRTEPCLRALLGQYEGDVSRLYDDTSALNTGVRTLIEHLERPNEAELTGYLVGILQLERRLARDRRRFGLVVEGLKRAASQADYFDCITHPSVITNLGDLYGTTISSMRPRILVRGERIHLEDERNAALIRALLLSCIRAAALWRSAGGNRWRLIFGRRRLLEEARSLLATT